VCADTLSFAPLIALLWLPTAVTTLKHCESFQVTQPLLTQLELSAQMMIAASTGHRCSSVFRGASSVLSAVVAGASRPARIPLSAAAAPPQQVWRARLLRTSAAVAAAPTTPSDGTRGLSFIEHAKQHGAASLIGEFQTHGRFDSCLAGMQIKRMDPSGDVETELLVTKAVENSYGTLHGGAITALIDVVGTLALLTKDNKRGGVSVRTAQKTKAM
jgi:hypothetical protein